MAPTFSPSSNWGPAGNSVHLTVTREKCEPLFERAVQLQQHRRIGGFPIADAKVLRGQSSAKTEGEMADRTAAASEAPHADDKRTAREQRMMGHKNARQKRRAQNGPTGRDDNSSASLDEPTNSHKHVSMDGTRNLLVRGLPVSVRTQLHGRRIAASSRTSFSIRCGEPLAALTLTATR